MEPKYIISSARKMTPKRQVELQKIAEIMTARGTPTEACIEVKHVRFFRLRWMWCKLRYRLIRR